MTSRGIVLLICGLLILTIKGYEAATVPCRLRDVAYGKVCVCTADYCDYLDNPTVTEDNGFAIISSSRQGLRFATQTGIFGSNEKYTIADYEEPNQAATNITVSDIISKVKKEIDDYLRQSFTVQSSSTTRSARLNVDRAKLHQTMLGFGGSFTGAVSYLVGQYPQSLQDQLYNSYYGAEGLGFDLMRISIGASDFELEPWAYNEWPENDLELSNMTQLDDRDLTRVSQIKRLIEVTGVDNLRIKGAAWGAPRWMKRNNQWSGFGPLKREYYQTWADYHLKWLELWESNGLPIWAISTGNEPMNGMFFMFFVRFISLGWTPQRQGIWLNDHLGPAIRNSKFKDLVIFGSDDQRYSALHWFKLMNRTRPNSVDYIDGVALHWYWDDIFGGSLVDATMNYLPGRYLIMSEACIGDKPWQKAAPLLGDWQRGEKYARSFLQTLQNGYHGWIDWNMILDEDGGPNYVDNTVDSPVIANTTTFEEFYKQPMFYVMGHFSKLVPEGSIRIDAIPSNINLDSVAFRRPDNKIVVVLFNSGRADLDITIIDSIRGTLVVNIPAKSIHTVLYN